MNDRINEVKKRIMKDRQKLLGRDLHQGNPT